MTQSTTGKSAKFLLPALLACALTAGLALNVGAADESPADAPEAATASQAAPGAAHRPDPGEFAKKHAKFLDDTKDLRRQIAMKEEAMKALKRSTQPDVNQIQQVAGELFDLREQMRAKAAENGLPPMMGKGPGHSCGGRGMTAGPVGRGGKGGQGGPDRQGGCMGMMGGHAHGAPMMGCMGQGRQDGMGHGPHHGAAPGPRPCDCER